MSVKIKFAFIFILSAFVLAALITWLHHGLVVDNMLENLFFDRTTAGLAPAERWLWPKTDRMLTFWLHDAIRDGFIALGVAGFLFTIISFFVERFRPYHYRVVLVTLSLIIIPAMVAVIKDNVRTYCPAKVQYYGGYAPDDYKLHSLPLSEVTKADCFPASHPSAGFALLVLGAMAVTRRGRIVGYATGMALGSALSIIQMGRGDHFLSHCLATFLIALWTVHMLVYMVNVFYPSYRKKTSYEPHFVPAGSPA